jgi:DNA polymerase-3 subunit alpha
MSFSKAFAEVKELADGCATVRIQNIRKVIRIAQTLEGCTRHHGISAAGVIIAPSDIRDHIPRVSPKDSQLLVTQYEGKVIEEAGLLKMDFLGLKNIVDPEGWLSLNTRRTTMRTHRPR